MTATESSVTGLQVGSSGFSYAGWKGGFYPADAKPALLLGYAGIAKNEIDPAIRLLGQCLAEFR